MENNGVYIPHHPEAEKSILGAIIRDNALIFEVSRLIDASDFHLYAHQVIWSALVELIVNRDTPADQVTLVEYLAGKKQIEDIGGFAYFADLWASAPAAGHALHYAQIVRERALHRRIIHTTADLHKHAIAPGTRPLDLIDRARAEFLSLAELRTTPLAEDDQAEDDHDWQPFPATLLPPILRRYIEEGAESLMIDPGMLVLPTLASVAGIIGNRYVARVKQDWLEPCILWGALVARSSSKKTPSFKLATAPLRALQDELLARYAADSEAYEIEAEAYKEAYRAADDAAARKDLGKPPQKPKRERVLVGDITVETLLELLAENPAGLTMAMDELAGFFGSFTRYRAAGGGTDRPLWLSMFSGVSLHYDRKSAGGRAIHIPHAAVSIIGTVQPAILSQLFGDDTFHSGLAARFLICMPPKKPHVFSDAVIPADTATAYERLIRALYEDQLNGVIRYDWRPRAVDFTAMGRESFRRFYNDWGRVQDQADGAEEYAFSKLEGYCPRLALLLAVVETHAQGADLIIDETHIERAAALVRWFAREATRVYACLRAGGNQGDTAALVEWIAAQGGRATARLLQRSRFGRGKSAGECRLILDQLVKSGRAKWEETAAGSQGGRKTMEVVLSPSR